MLKSFAPVFASVFMPGLFITMPRFLAAMLKLSAIILGLCTLIFIFILLPESVIFIPPSALISTSVFVSRLSAIILLSTSVPVPRLFSLFVFSCTLVLSLFSLLFHILFLSNIPIPDLAVKN